MQNTKIAQYTTTMPFHFKSSKPNFSANHNPWRETPDSADDELRRSFKAFCQMENFRRAERNEVPFCSNSNRDKAFEKLMRLSRGEEPITWEIQPPTEEELGIEQWYADFFKDEEEGGVKIEDENKTDKTNANENKAGVGHERKDSKEVVAKCGERWRRKGEGEENVNENKDEDEDGVKVERIEDIDVAKLV
jgi:hypothetical protein